MMSVTVVLMNDYGVRDDHSLSELGGAADDVRKALNDLLNHIKDGGPDKIPDIMDQIMVASGELIQSHDSQDMVRQARVLAQATAELIQAIKGEAESQTDSDLQVSHHHYHCYHRHGSEEIFLLLLT